ncbi:MAG: hypothetical protein J6T74_05810 [Clostridia bacterium]|nr:hypothetical protein [Clostridia bacterium]
MVEEFEFWINSIMQDYPPPEELNSMLFILKQQKSFAYLEISFYEGIPSFNKLAYRVLESEFFTHDYLKVINKLVLLNRVKNMIEDVLTRNEFKIYLKNKKIYLLFNEKIEYLFTI